MMTAMVCDGPGKGLRAELRPIPEPGEGELLFRVGLAEYRLRPGDTLTVVTKEPKYHFVPSNPWIAVGWRKPADIEVDLAPVFAKKGIAFKPVAATKLVALRAAASVHLDARGDAASAVPVLEAAVALDPSLSPAIAGDGRRGGAFGRLRRGNDLLRMIAAAVRPRANAAPASPPRMP